MFQSIRDLVASSLRYKLLLLVLFPMALVLPTILGVSIFWSQKYTYDQLYAKVNTDLTVAHDVFSRLQKEYLTQLKSLAESYQFRVSLEANDWGRLHEQLDVFRQTTKFEFLHITDFTGRWQELQKDGVFKRKGKPSPLLVAALREGNPGVGVEIFSRDDLQAEGGSLAERVRLALVYTPRAEPTSRTIEDRAMVVRAVHPVRDARGHVIAALDGGVLLNNNFTFVDRIRDLVYGPGSIPEGGWGTVTVFLDDVRITTNVPLSKGERALGTRVSQVVRDQVLSRGENWIDRAFVVNDWYISAYEPIVDVYGERVGMLYAGYLEAPYRDAYLKAMTVLSIAIFIAVMFAGWVVVRGAKSIFNPVEAMTNLVRATQRGEHRRIGMIESKDEIGELARQFDDMLELLKERNRQIEQAAENLELKVEERTRELREKNVHLQKSINLLRQTRQQLAIAEKLAALGELTAGVAHEINNPTAVILGNIDVLKTELGDDGRSVEAEIELIVEQAYRIRSIIDKLLQYARPAEYAGYLDELDVNDAVADTLTLVKHELDTKNTVIRTAYHACTPVRINRQELQQVLVNLLINANHSTPSGGVIEITTRDSAHGTVAIEIKDYGVGIPLEELGKVFDPFYTRKKSGTGLGLSVSYGLIRRYGGVITVDSEEGRWTLFTVFLRPEPVFEDGEEVLRHWIGDSSGQESLRSST
ncbi:MAG: cache domain-containing protein [Gammaproteobacteria bacterium]|nr:cache domain-containing protein [Gammaproteobacteria bacterium]